MKEDVKIDFAIGGQAVIEGIMMRSPHFYTLTVRNPEGGMDMKQEAFVSLTKRKPWLNVPLIRGVVHMVESMVLGFRCLDYSNAIFMGDDPEKKTDRGMVKKVVFGFFGLLYTLGTLAFTLFLMKVLPLWVAGKVAALWPLVEDHYFLFNAIDGLTKVAIFVLYVLAITLMKDIRRVFQYHGAEHKTVWAYEKGLDLTVANARKQSRFHPRCGTSFIFVVILMSIVVYTLIPPMNSFWEMLASRIVVIPVIAGLGYELLKASAKCEKNILLRALVYPGQLIQHLTTREPDDSQLEIAIHSLKESLKAEHGHS